MKLLSGPALAAALLGAGLSAQAAQAAENAQTMLLRQPAVSRDHLAFVYAGDIWLTDRAGQHP
ncbi:hypothetical protein, partial [Undibacterium sp.]|uniref:hypothetical protein n=1 Tax=Undibacterium sp. TaxID=1914977 RepID=UPI002CE66290